MDLVELRQYELQAGAGTAFVRLFEEVLTDPQVAAGMAILGTFVDVQQSDRFIWLRGFEHYAARPANLERFYRGPVWQEYRGRANSLMVDSDNVLLLRPVVPLDMPAADPTAPRGAVMIVVHPVAMAANRHVHDLDRDFREAAIAAGGTPVATFVSDPRPNNDHLLPIREGENVFVTCTRFANAPSADEMHVRLGDSLPGRRLGDALAHWERAPAQVLKLAPTRTSRVR